MGTARQFSPTADDFAGGTDPDHDAFVRAVLDDPDNPAVHAAFSDWLADRGRHFESLRHQIWAIDSRFELLTHFDADRLVLNDFAAVPDALDRLRSGIARMEQPLVFDADTDPETRRRLADWPWRFGLKLKYEAAAELAGGPLPEQLCSFEVEPGMWRLPDVVPVLDHAPLVTGRFGPVPFGPAGIDRLGALPNLRHLDISGETIADADFGGKRFPALRRLEIWQGKRLKLRGLRDIPHLERLDLKHVTLDPSAAGELRALTRLRHLHVQRTSGIDLAGVIGGMTGLERLELGNTDIPIPRLADLVGLTHLLAVSASFDDDAMKAVAGFPRLRSLWAWNIRWTQPVTAAFERLRDLRELDLSVRRFTDEGYAFLHALPNLIRFRTWGPRTGQPLEGLRGTNNLRIASISHTGLTDEACRPLAEFKQLHVLGCYGERVGNAGLAHLRDLEWLTSLNLSFTDVTAGGFKHLKRLRRLRELSIRKHPRIRKDAADRLAKHLPFVTIRR